MVILNFKCVCVWFNQKIHLHLHYLQWFIFLSLVSVTSHRPIVVPINVRLSTLTLTGQNVLLNYRTVGPCLIFFFFYMEALLIHYYKAYNGADSDSKYVANASLDIHRLGYPTCTLCSRTLILWQYVWTGMRLKNV